MNVAVTGATGFIGRYIVRKLLAEGHNCRCWFRNPDRCFSIDDTAASLTWQQGELGNRQSCEDLVVGCDAVVHSGLHRHGESFRGGEGDIAEFVQKNVVGSIQLIEAARAAGVRRFVFLSTCAVHEKILDDRPLDETHPLWMTTHYGAYKAAVEQFVHSYGFGVGFPIVALRPTGVYGLHHEPQRSKWFELISRIKNGDDVECRRGVKEVHAGDVADAVEDRHYRHWPKAERVPFGDALRDTVNFLGVLIAANIFALVLYVMFPPFALFIFWGLNGFLLGREYFTLAAIRREGRAGAKALRKRHIGKIWIAGTLMAMPLSLPLVNLVIPILGAATFTHLYHQIQAQAPSGQRNPDRAL